MEGLVPELIGGANWRIRRLGAVPEACTVLGDVSPVVFEPHGCYLRRLLRQLTGEFALCGELFAYSAVNPPQSEKSPR